MTCGMRPRGASSRVSPSSWRHRIESASSLPRFGGVFIFRAGAIPSPSACASCRIHAPASRCFLQIPRISGVDAAHGAQGQTVGPEAEERQASSCVSQAHARASVVIEQGTIAVPGTPLPQRSIGREKVYVFWRTETFACLKNNPPTLFQGSIEAAGYPSRSSFLSRCSRRPTDF